MTLLPVVETCDNYSLLTTTDSLLPFCLTTDSEVPIGWLLPPVVELLRQYNEAHSETLAPFAITPHLVSFAQHIDSFEARSAVAKHLCEMWRDEGHFANVIGGRLWRNELYPIYTTPFSHLTKGSAAFVMERVCCALFGFVTYGVHMTMYTKDGRIWVPKRAASKQTWPGYYDNSVAGGIPYGLTPRESLIKECMEEASLSEDIAQGAQSVGAISYFYQTTKGWLQPEVEYVYDLLVPAPEENVGEDLLKYIPRPSDGEVEAFELLSIEETLTRIKDRKFKPNTALVVLDFLIRHGHVTPENEPNFLEIETRLHGRYGWDAYVAMFKAKSR